MIRLILCALLIVGCGTDEPASQSGRLVIDKTHASRPLFMEGSVTHLRIVGPDGTAVVDETRRRGPVFDQALPTGSYTVETVERPCDGNCGYLDPPVESTRCELDVEITAGGTTEVSLALKGEMGAAACDLS